MIRRAVFVLSLLSLYVASLTWHYLPFVLVGVAGYFVGRTLSERKHRRELVALIREHAQEITKMARRVDTAQATSDRLIRERGQDERWEDTGIARQSREAVTWEQNERGEWMPL